MIPRHRSCFGSASSSQREPDIYHGDSVSSINRSNILQAPTHVQTYFNHGPFKLVISSQTALQFLQTCVNQPNRSEKFWAPCQQGFMEHLHVCREGGSKTIINSGLEFQPSAVFFRWRCGICEGLLVHRFFPQDAFPKQRTKHKLSLICLQFFSASHISTKWPISVQYY